MLIKTLKSFNPVGNSIIFPRILNARNSSFNNKPIQVILKRNASIHTRNILIQKAKLEHISNFGIFLLVFPATTFGLGIWQIKRKVWKEQLIASLKNQMSKEPIELPEDLTQLNDMEYQPVKVRGHFLHDQELYLGPRTLIETEENKKKGGVLTIAPKSGYLIITPFQLENRNEIILINRGWVPKHKKNPITRSEGQITEPVEVIGIARKHENRPQFMPKLKEGNLFLYRDVERMSHLTGAVPCLLDATSLSNIPGGPIGGQTNITLRNEHLSYVATWFSLSGLSAYFWFKLVYLVPK